MRVKKATIAFVVLVAAGVVLFATRTGTDVSVDDAARAQVAVPLTVARSYADGIHALRGAYTVPTVCDTATTTAMVGEGGDIELRITHSPVQGICLTRAVAVPFSLSVEAPEDAPVRIFVNDRVVPVAAE